LKNVVVYVLQLNQDFEGTSDTETRISYIILKEELLGTKLGEEISLFC